MFLRGRHGYSRNLDHDSFSYIMIKEMILEEGNMFGLLINFEWQEE